MQCQIHPEVVAEVLRHLGRNIKDSLVASHGLSLRTGGFSQKQFRLNGDERWHQGCWKARRAYYSFFDERRGTHLHHAVRVSHARRGYASCCSQSRFLPWHGCWYKHGERRQCHVRTTIIRKSRGLALNVCVVVLVVCRNLPCT